MVREAQTAQNKAAFSNNVKKRARAAFICSPLSTDGFFRITNIKKEQGEQMF